MKRILAVVLAALVAACDGTPSDWNTEAQVDVIEHLTFDGSTTLPVGRSEVSSLSSALGVLDQMLSPSGAYGCTSLVVGTPTERAQEFIPTLPTLVAAQVYVTAQSNYPDPTLRISIHQGPPTGPVLGATTAVVPAAGGSSLGQWVDAVFPSTISVTPGQTYSIRVGQLMPNGDPQLDGNALICFGYEDPYPSGNSWWRPLLDSWRSASDIDLFFATYGEPIPVDVDIKPQSCPNAFNVTSKGVTPVAILGTEDFDVTQVDPASVALEGVSPLRWDLKDVSTPAGISEPCTEEGEDGIMDLVLQFDTPELVAALGDVSDGDLRTLLVHGQLKEEFGGMPIRGQDELLIIKRERNTLPDLEELSLADDDFEAVDLGFTFRYQGQRWDHVYVNSNGNLTFGAGDTDFSESVAEFLEERPRIAALWDDLNPAAGGAIFVERSSTNGKHTAMTVRFVEVPEFGLSGGANTFSITLNDNSQFEIRYGDLTALDGLAGATEGGGALDPGETDLSEAGGELPSRGTTYERFTGDFDLAGTTLSFERNVRLPDAPLLESEVLPLSDDGSEVVRLGFKFEFQGVTWERVYVNSNGNLTFGSGDRDFTESVVDFLDGPPRIAPFWDDLNPAVGGEVSVLRTFNRGGKVKALTVHFVDVPEFGASAGANTFSVTLKPDGEFDIVYGALTASDALVGSTEGGGAFDPGETDLSTVTGSVPAMGTVYELFTDDFDLGGLSLLFRPL